MANTQSFFLYFFHNYVSISLMLAKDMVDQGFSSAPQLEDKWGDDAVIKAIAPVTWEYAVLMGNAC